LSSRKQRRVKTTQSLSIKTKEKKCLGGLDSNQSTKGSSGSSNSNTNSFKFSENKDYHIYDNIVKENRMPTVKAKQQETKVMNMMSDIK
jgi:hypothetical protein